MLFLYVIYIYMLCMLAVLSSVILNMLPFIADLFFSANKSLHFLLWITFFIFRCANGDGTTIISNDDEAFFLYAVDRIIKLVG